jgi:uncharacterized protein
MNTLQFPLLHPLFLGEIMTNVFCWVDIPVIDLDRAIRFYTAILKQEVKKVSEHGFEFGLFPHEDDNVAGCLSAMGDRKPSQDGPLVYLTVEGRLDDAIMCAQAKGATIIKEKEQMGPYGNRAIILDSEGNAIALYSKSP